MNANKDQNSGLCIRKMENVGKKFFLLIKLEAI